MSLPGIPSYLNKHTNWVIPSISPDEIARHLRVALDAEPGIRYQYKAPKYKFRVVIEEEDQTRVSVRMYADEDHTVVVEFRRECGNRRLFGELFCRLSTQLRPHITRLYSTPLGQVETFPFTLIRSWLHAPPLSE